MEALLSQGEVPIDGFLCPGHVSVVIGPQAYEPIAERYGKPCVIAGFEPGQMLVAILRLVEQIAAGESQVDNVYGVAVGEGGNPIARQMMARVFEPADTIWRAMGTIPHSGLELRPRYKRFDALAHFGLNIGPDRDPPGCRCGEVIQGKVQPSECALFGAACSWSASAGSHFTPPSSGEWMAGCATAPMAQSRSRRAAPARGWRASSRTFGGDPQAPV